MPCPPRGESIVGQGRDYPARVRAARPSCGPPRRRELRPSESGARGSPTTRGPADALGARRAVVGDDTPAGTHQAPTAALSCSPCERSYCGCSSSCLADEDGGAISSNEWSEECRQVTSITLVHRALPDLPLIRRRKIVLSMPIRIGSGARGAQAWAKMNGVPARAQMGVVNAEEVDKKVRSLLANGNNNGIWLIPYPLSVEAWVRAHG
jgi:hypothetical protein